MIDIIILVYIRLYMHTQYRGIESCSELLYKLFGHICMGNEMMVNGGDVQVTPTSYSAYIIIHVKNF